MARTRTWSTTIPIDHTQIKLGPTKIRDLRTDLEERVDGILAGFVNTGSTNGLLLGRLLTVGTANATNPGTGTAAAIDIFGMTTGTLTELVIRNSSGHEILATYQGRLQVGKLGNDQYMVGVGTGSGDVNILKVNTAGVTQFASHPIGPDTNPSTPLSYVPVGYFGTTNAAGGIVMLDTSSQLPAVSGALLTGVVNSSSSYDTGAQSFVVNTAYTVTHNLGTTKVLIQPYFRENTGVNWKLCGYVYYDNAARGFSVCDIQDNSISYRVPTGVRYMDTGGTLVDITSGQSRIIVLALP
jgi:hypothetical protein